MFDTWLVFDKLNMFDTWLVFVSIANSYLFLLAVRCIDGLSCTMLLSGLRLTWSEAASFIGRLCVCQRSKRCLWVTLHFPPQKQLKWLMLIMHLAPSEFFSYAPLFKFSCNLMGVSRTLSGELSNSLRIQEQRNTRSFLLVPSTILCQRFLY